MFLDTIKNTFKILIKEKQMLFWAFIFPIILASLFNLAFSNIISSNQFKKIPIAINKELYKDESFKVFIKSMEEENYFKVEITNTDNFLSDENLLAYIDKDKNVKTKKSGIKETIVESIINAYIQKENMIKRVIEENKNVDFNKILEVKEHINDISNKNMNYINAFFYSLIGMQLMYSYGWGLYVINLYEANLSTLGKRNFLAPTSKITRLLISLLVAWTISITIVLFTMIILNKFLNIDFGDRIYHLLLLVIIAAMTGVSFGTFIGSSSKASIAVKSGFAIAITMILSFLAGMMKMDMKIIIEDKIPILNKINPVSLITDSIYSLYYYNGLERFFENLLYLSTITLIFIILTFFFIRGKQYDSL